MNMVPTPKKITINNDKIDYLHLHRPLRIMMSFLMLLIHL